MRLRKESSKRPVAEQRRESPPDFANLTVELLKPVQHSKRYAITNVDSLGVIERFTYTEITREAARWAQLLREKGLQPGDRVVIVAGREWGWRCAVLGAIHAGGVAVPCPASLSLREIRTVADHAGASLLVSLRPRPDLVEIDGRTALTMDDLDAVDPARALERPPHGTESRDVALIIYAWRDLDLTGTMHTHASLLAQADAAEHWLGVDEDERIWATADDGSGPSIWLLLAAWRRAASIVVVDLELDSEAKLELLDRLRPAAVWFDDDEYRMLGSAEVPPWVDLRSIRRALVDTEETEGAISFATAFGAALVPVFALDERGVVAGRPAGHEGRADATTAQPTPGVQFAVVGGDGTELPPGEVGDVAVRGDAPTLFTGYAGREGRSRSAEWFRFGWRGALTAEGALRLEARSPSELEPVDASTDLPVPEVVEEPAAEEPVAAEPESAAPGWRARRTAERARRDQERAADEERRRHETQEARESAGREKAEAQAVAARQAAEAEERRRQEQTEAFERAEREDAAEARRVEEAQQRAAAEAEAHRLAEEEAKHRAEDEKRREEERRREETEAREREAREAKEREKAEAEERRRNEEQVKAEQAVAAAEAMQRAEEEKRLAKDRQREEKEVRARAEREAKEREKAEAEERRRAEEEAKIQAKREAAEAKQRAKEEKEREEREAKERVEREKAEAEAAKAQAKIDAAEAKQRAKDEKEREKRDAKERVEREKAEAEAAKVQAKIDAAEAKQRAKDEKEREKREAVERAEREKAEAEAAKAQQRQAEVDAKKHTEEEKLRAKEREREENEARRRAEQEAKEAERAERRAAREEKRRRAEAPKPEDGQRRFGRRRREVVEELEPQHAPDVVARIKQYGMTAESNDSPAEPSDQPEGD